MYALRPSLRAARFVARPSDQLPRQSSSTASHVRTITFTLQLLASLTTEGKKVCHNLKRDKNRYYTGIKVGTKLVGSTKSDVAIKQNVGSLIEMNERALRGITSSRAASEQKVAQLSLAFKSYLETHGIEAPVKVDRSLVKLDSDRDLAGIVETGQGHQSSVFMLPLDRHVNVSGPPYDFEWNWGNPTTKETHLDDGYFGVRVNSEDTHAAAAGIGLVLSSEKQALVSVRAHVRTFWNWSVATTGFFRTLSCGGGIDLSAWVDGKLCTKVRRDLSIRGRSKRI